jgi:hypothetical protein
MKKLPTMERPRSNRGHEQEPMVEEEMAKKETS